MKNKIILILSLSLITLIQTFGQEVDFVRPAPQGLLVFSGMDLADGKKVDHYTIERSYNKKQWEKVSELKSPANWDEFYRNIQMWKKEFSFQELPKPEKLKELWLKASMYGCIDSMKYWSASTIIRLAAGIIYYDKQVPKSNETWFRVSRFDSKGKSASEVESKPASWPFIPAFDNISLADKNIDKKLYYLKWESTGSAPATYFGIKYYDNLVLKEATGLLTKYKLGNKTYYIFQDSTANLQGDRQFFLIPMDVYGNPGVATGITIVSKASVSRNYFVYNVANAVKKGYGITLSWKLNNPSIVKDIKIYRSDSFDKKAYELAATVPGTDTTFIDRDIKPDKFYYYYMVTGSKVNDFPVQSNIFFDATYDELKPIQPSIIGSNPIPGGVELKVNIAEVNIWGIQVYRNDGNSNKLLPVGDLLKPVNNTINFKDTSEILSGGKTYTYAAKAVNTSHQESEFSNTVHVMPDIKTKPQVPSNLSAFEENRQVKLLWDDMSVQNRIIKGYAIYRRELPSGKFAPLLAKDSICLSNYFTDHSAKAGKSYEYAVRSVDYFGGTSNEMAAYSIQVSDNIPPVPTNLYATEVEGKVIIKWGEIITKEPLQLNIYRYKRGSKPVLLKSLSLKETELSDTSVKKGELYFYFSKLANGDNVEGSPSQEISVRLN